MQSTQPWLKPERSATVNCQNISHVNESAGDEISNGEDSPPMEQDEDEDGGQSGGGEGLQLLDYSLDFCQNDVVPTKLESAWELNGKLDSRKWKGTLASP